MVRRSTTVRVYYVLINQAINDYKMFFVFKKSEYIHHSIKLFILSLSKKLFDKAVHHSLRLQQVLVRHVATGDT